MLSRHLAGPVLSGGPGGGLDEGGLVCKGRRGERGLPALSGETKARGEPGRYLHRGQIPEDFHLQAGEVEGCWGLSRADPEAPLLPTSPPDLHNVLKRPRWGESHGPGE